MRRRLLLRVKGKVLPLFDEFALNSIAVHMLRHELPLPYP